MNEKIITASIRDIPNLLPLINSAYRGEASRRGWTTEADIIDGDVRIAAKDLQEALEIPGAVMLKINSNKHEPAGCVYLKPVQGGMYLGMLSVWPYLQAGGIGKKLMEAAEQYASANGYDKIVMQVINVREELIAWYKRQGYNITGETVPFEDGKFGKAKIPLFFIVLEKILNKNV